MRKIKSCPQNLALLKNNKKLKTPQINTIVPLILTNFKQNIQESKLFFNIGMDNVYDFLQYTPVGNNKLITYLVELLSEVIKNNFNKEIISKIIFNIFFRFSFYSIFHYSENIIQTKKEIITELLKITGN